MVTGSEVEIKGSSDAGTTFYHVLVNTDGEVIIADGTTVVVTDGATGISQIKGSTDAGTTFYFVKVNASGELVTADGTVVESQIKGSTDGGTTFYNVLVNASGELVIADGTTVLNQNYGWNGTNWHKTLIDVNTRTQVTTDFAHHQIHAENFFHTGLNTADLDSNPLRINFTTPSGTTYAHLLVSAYVSGQAVLVLREAYTGGGSGGSTLTPFNRNRNSDNASILLSTHGTPAAGILTQGAAAGTGGIELINESLGSGKNKQTGESRNDNEWVLKASTSYQLELTSSTNDITATLAGDWYEHTNEAA